MAPFSSRAGPVIAAAMAAAASGVHHLSLNEGPLTTSSFFTSVLRDSE